MARGPWPCPPGGPPRHRGAWPRPLVRRRGPLAGRVRAPASSSHVGHITMATVSGAGSTPASGPPTDERRPAIAVVDADSRFAGYLPTFLALRGYEARSYTRGDEIVAAIRHGEPPDLVLLDVAMPGMDGLQT